MLAVLCQKVAESQEVSSLDVEQARQLRDEWKLLIGGALPMHGLNTHDHIQSYAEQLKRHWLPKA